MILQELLEVNALLANPSITAEIVKDYLLPTEVPGVTIAMDTLSRELSGKSYKTEVISIRVAGKSGKTSGGSSPTACIIGQLGAIAVRPYSAGLVSDADGALCALSVAKKVIEMQAQNDRLEGDIFITTHICPEPPLKLGADGEPSYPYSILAPVDFTIIHAKMLELFDEMNPAEPVADQIDVFFSVDATKGNSVVNVADFAVTPVVKNGWILPFPEAMLTDITNTTADYPNLLPLSIYDITPYELLYDADYNINITRINSILAPSIKTDKPYIGVATTARVNVPGGANNVNFYRSLESAARFMLEASKRIGEGRYQVYDEQQVTLAESIIDLSGFRGLGNEPA